MQIAQLEWGLKEFLVIIPKYITGLPYLDMV